MWSGLSTGRSWRPRPILRALSRGLWTCCWPPASPGPLAGPSPGITGHLPRSGGMARRRVSASPHRRPAAWHQSGDQAAFRSAQRGVRRSGRKARTAAQGTARHRNSPSSRSPLTKQGQTADNLIGSLSGSLSGFPHACQIAAENGLLSGLLGLDRRAAATFRTSPVSLCRYVRRRKAGKRWSGEENSSWLELRAVRPCFLGVSGEHRRTRRLAKGQGPRTVPCRRPLR